MAQPLSYPEQAVPTDASPLPDSYRCGECGELFPLTHASRNVRCPACDKHLKLPHRIEVACRRCGECRRLRLSHRHIEQRCTACGEVLEIGTPTLKPRRRRRRRRGRSSRGRERVFVTIFCGACMLLVLAIWLSK